MGGRFATAFAHITHSILSGLLVCSFIRSFVLFGFAFDDFRSPIIHTFLLLSACLLRIAAVVVVVVCSFIAYLLLGILNRTNSN